MLKMGILFTFSYAKLEAVERPGYVVESADFADEFQHYSNLLEFLASFCGHLPPVHMLAAVWVRGCTGVE